VIEPSGNTDTKQDYVVNALPFRGLLFFFVASLWLQTAPAWGQACPTASTPAAQIGDFTVPSKVCQGQTVTVTNVDPTLTNVSYNYRYDGVSGIGTFATTASQTSPINSVLGTFTIIQTGSRPGQANPGTIACRVVEVVRPDAPVTFTAISCGTTATLSYTLAGDAAKFDELVITWGNGATSVIPVTAANLIGSVKHTYVPRTLPFTYTIRGRYKDSPSSCLGNLRQGSVTVRPLSGANPVFLEMSSSASSISMRYSVDASHTVEILRKDPGAAGYVSTGLINPPNPFTVAAPSDKSTCFQIVTRDACGGNERRSPETCSMVASAEAGDKQNTVRWNAYSGEFTTFRRYVVYRNGAPITSYSGLGTLQHIDDTNIRCGQRYCYRVEANPEYPPGSVLGGPTLIRSAETCVTGVDKSSIAGPTSMYVLVQGNNSEVYMQATLPTPPPTSYTLLVERATSFSGPYTQLGTNPTGATFTDTPTQSSEQSYCYRTAIQNNCGVTSPFTPPACTILLKQDPDGKLRWTSESPFSDAKPTRLVLIPIDAVTGQPVVDPATGGIQSFDITNAKEFDPKTVSNQQTAYQITAEGPKVDSYSNTIDISLLMKLFVPTAFSPNGDAENDAFMPKGEFWEQLELTLFDRWGNPVFSTTQKDSRGWDGTIGGAPAAEGHYTYRIKITDIKGNAFERTGRVLLLR
jgi:gliding motility-associated-like protein